MFEHSITLQMLVDICDPIFVKTGHISAVSKVLAHYFLRSQSLLPDFNYTYKLLQKYQRDKAYERDKGYV